MAVIRSIDGDAGDGERNALAVSQYDFLRRAGGVENLVPERQARWRQCDRCGGPCLRCREKADQQKQLSGGAPGTHVVS